MDDKTQKERLEQELRFLKESFEAEVISKEEFEKGEDRIEKKLKEIGKSAKEHMPQEKKEEPEIRPIQENQKSEEKQKTDAAIQSKDGEKIKLKIIQDETEAHGHEHVQETRQKVAEETAAEKPETVEEKKEGKFFKYAVVFIILALVAYFSYPLFLKGGQAQQKTSEVKFVAACNSDSDCKQEEKEGTCVGPGTKDARCEFKEMQKTNIFVINDRKNCFNCDTQRVLGILESWLGPISPQEIEYGTGIGKAMAEKFSLNLLPAYILDENITKNSGFEQFKQAFGKKDSSYILNGDAAGSSFYFRHDNVPGRLDLFVISGDDASTKAENNLKEFLQAFKEVRFEKHSADDELTKEINIKSFPTFLVNNRVKFSGVHPAETIKENFCKLNKLPECEKVLSKSLV